MNFIKNNSYVVLIIVLCMGFAIIGSSKYGNEQTVTKITISEGDTLWGLANHHSENMSADKWIKEVIKLNDLPSATIKKGEDLLLPAVRAVEKNNTLLAGVNR
ncbi:LysM peptidoglycan-binding domain-containing protein [Sporosarcina sp. ANT_H38]|uniref:cell division suppressor protein YneA n=1 Tax=Sporosarcina sp. ANT_H38 TaxID=2597358 RepID=UPI0011F3A534|nr:LysM peptidoglycan-binding domain-containing protein [Sporosarcina sp. ANT_H38]KAA0966436.1 LysM peptidoglycan-binding domain-containing protein [Sporosarcina sp. ANT_H38]